jgi:hypothetical protein
VDYTKGEEIKIQATEMKLLRAIMQKSKRDRIKNAHIREELRMENIQNRIEGKRLRWFRHAKRMDEHRIPKRLQEMKMTGRRHPPPPGVDHEHGG